MAKTKIELFEDKLIEEGLTDERLHEFEKLLKKSGNDWSRIQHCIITAYNFPVERIDEAVKLIKFGIDRYGNDSSGWICSYQMLGKIYYRAGLYQKAYDTYVNIYPNIGNFRGEFPWCLLNTKMHADNFTYSPELEKYLGLCQNENEFAKSFLNNKFMMALAEYIIADNYRRKEKKEEAYSAIRKMVEPNYAGPLFGLLKKHKHDERLIITDECKAFLERMGKDQ